MLRFDHMITFYQVVYNVEISLGMVMLTGSVRIRFIYRGLARPVLHNLCELQSLARLTLFDLSVRWLACFCLFIYFLIFMIKLSIFKNSETLRSSQKLSKDFGELDDKLIIQHFHHIHLHTMTYTMYSLNFSTLKNT